MSDIGASASIYLKFLNLVRALDSSPVLPSLDPTEVQLLNRLVFVWASDKRTTVLEAMRIDQDVSPTTIHRRLKSLKSKGVLDFEVNGRDNRVKYVVPTELAETYFAQLSMCVLAATKDI
jgi:DNA-binding MarR family transcriptional regulator